MDPSGDGFFQKLFETTPHPYLVLAGDPRFTILAVNERYLEATGTTREGLLGRGLFEAFPDDPADAASTSVADLRTSLLRVLGDRRPDTMGVQKYDIPAADGGFEVRYWSPVNTPVLDDRGRVAWIIHHVEDVTEFILGQERADREQAERLGTVEARAGRMVAEVLRRAAEVKDANRALKTALAELEWRESELARLNGRLQELDRLKSDFFATISHELRTPLTLILGPLRARLASPDLAPDLRADLERMQRNARVLLAQVNDLLDLARLDAGRMVLHPAGVDLARLARLEASRFEGLAAERGTAFRVDTPECLPARADAEKFRRILANLLANASKFTPAGGRIRLALAAVDGRVALEVADSGPGVPEALREAVFDRFRQVQDGAGRPKGGTGLGLAIVREFAQLHGGRVALDQAPEGGARFRVELPLVPADLEGPGDDGEAAEVPELLAAGWSPAAPAAAPPGAHRILVVEDHPDMRDYLAAALGRYHRVETAADGPEALARALADPPDLVLSDVMMPGLTGDRLVEELHRHPELEGVPIVLLTARADEDLRVRMLRSGVADCLFKPFSLEVLLARVGALLEERRRRQRARLAQLEELRLDAAMMDNAAVGLYLVGAGDGRILRTSRGLEAMFGYGPGELAGRHASVLNAPGTVTPAGEGHAEAGPPVGGNWTGEALSRHRDGTAFWTLVTKTAFHHARLGEVWVAARSDLTERRRAEQALRQLKAGLERRVAERTAELETANREMESFSYAVSHDLRAPLRAMSGFSRALVEDLGPRLADGERTYLDQIDQAARRMAGLIDGILQLSRLSRAELGAEAVDLSALAAQVRAELEQAEPGRPVRWELAPDLRAWGDPRQLEALVRNLLGNAWKHSSGREPAVIRLEGGRRDGTTVFTVADNGAGFDMAYASKLFQPFQRLHRQDEFPGLGIGLATVQRIVNRHRGRIEAEARPGQGAAFTVSLPWPATKEATP